MKLTLLLCGVALMVAGCASSPPNPFAFSGEFSYTYDLVPPPLPGISPDMLVKIEQAQPASYTDQAYRQWAAQHNESR